MNWFFEGMFGRLFLCGELTGSTCSICPPPFSLSFLLHRLLDTDSFFSFFSSWTLESATFLFSLFIVLPPSPFLCSDTWKYPLPFRFTCLGRFAADTSVLLSSAFLC